MQLPLVREKAAAAAATLNELDQINTATQSNFTELAAEIVSAYIAHNPISSSDLPRLIGEIYAALKGLQSKPVEEPGVELTPAV